MMHIVYGILLFIVGLVITTFIDNERVQKIGSGLMIVGVILAVAFPLLINWWNSSQTFQYIVYGAGLFVVFVLILFSGLNTKKKKR